MNVLYVVLGVAIILFIAYQTYGNFLAKKVFKLDDAVKTPAMEVNDGQDFVPAKKGMLMGQHFSAIAAAGPINGPILAGVMFGWVPAMIWVIIGSIFIGGMHDMGSLIASIRHKARSITEVIKNNVSNRAWVLFMIFIWITLVYIIVAFTDITASSFVGTITLENGDKIGGSAIASSSIMYLILPIIMGLLLKTGKLSETAALCIFLPLVGVAIWAGGYLPVSLPIDNPAVAQKVWGVLILVYCLIASIMPMWLLLQPRGALGGYFLYIALIAAAIGVIFGGYTIQYPAFTKLGPGGMDANFWYPMAPVLFITIACGACSGFHALVSSGTTSKQVEKESDVKPIGYGAMLLEGLVAAVSLACVMILAKDSPLLSKAPNFIYASGIGSFLELIGIPAVYGISFGLLAFTTFVYDTLDVCTRLGRYIIEEMTGWKNWAGKIIGTALTAGVPVFFIFATITDAKGNPVPAWLTFWGIFGASNQLLAALALVGIAIWLKKTDSKYWMTAFVPAIFMFLMSNWALLINLHTGWVKGLGHPAIPWVSLILIILSIMVGAETTVAMMSGKKSNPTTIAK
ncbi:carbon starvation protein A [Acetonema longum]|uniref:Carbon starvation protein CstA n=1 Tax=Acetonema longum DSM 6540 TaxID=1009370 RepID=F7NFK7_9FIRM|nr:carbon starvation CstA family protein [Acetonema longum]EGO65170.1 carbon starvation protein CstA [Acetonema longum DSM 6540]